jgi:hypothetical protein
MILKKQKKERVAPLDHSGAALFFCQEFLLNGEVA